MKVCPVCNTTVAPFDPERQIHHGVLYHGECLKIFLRRCADSLVKLVNAKTK